MFKIKSRRSGNIFGSKSLNNVTIFGGSCHTLMENQDTPSDTGVLSELEREGQGDADHELTGVMESNETNESGDVLIT